MRKNFLKFITSNKFENPQDNLMMDEVLRYSIFNIALLVGAIFLLVFGATVIVGGNTIRGMADLLIGFMCIIIIFLLRTRLPFVVCGLIVLVPFGILCAGLLLIGGEQGFAGLWIYTYPLFVIFILGLYIGSILSGLLLAAIMTITFIPGVAGYNYFPPIAFRFMAVYFLVLFITIAYEQIRILKERWVRQLTAALKSERDEIAVMKDNLKAGIFLMDDKYTIQPAYSKALEEIIGVDELQGKRFTDLLAASIKAKERDTLEDYFEMVIKRSFDAKMLEEINPITEFSYLNELTGEEKILRTTFAAVDRGYDTFFIMGSLEDITIEKLLQQQLMEEENRRDEEMRALFQVIQVEPRVFNDFIEDTEYEFDRINHTLKDKKLSAGQAMVDIYQSVHAIKSNAVILGLENFSGKLHELESKIKELRNRDDIAFEEVLHITVELEKIMKEKDKFRDTINKIQDFKVNVGESRRQDRYVLVETLTKACEKAASATNKKARFVVEELDGMVLEYGPRRVIKEVLTQLVRNAVYHGIETPEERTALGKKPEGVIQLFIKHENHQICIRLSDDGKGLNFERIREKAEHLHLLKEPNTTDKNQLIKVIFAPGFSTAEVTDAHAGRGIGLNLVRERIRELQGSIKLQSEPGKGTIFNIYIPLEIKSAVNKAS
jgi:two-component system chemotaxis sensor kinase CheA